MSLRRIIFFAVLVLSSVTASAQFKIIPKERLDSIANPPLATDAAFMKFEQTQIAAPPMKESDAPVTFEYRYENAGESPLTVTRLVSTCSCAAAMSDMKPVEPGRKGVITVRYNPEGHPGKFVRRVFVYTGDNRQPSAVLRLSVTVTE